MFPCLRCDAFSTRDNQVTTQLHNHRVTHNPSLSLSLALFLSEVKTGRGVQVWNSLQVCSCTVLSCATHTYGIIYRKAYDSNMLCVHDDKMIAMMYPPKLFVCINVFFKYDYEPTISVKYPEQIKQANE